MEHAGRVERVVTGADEHGGETHRTAYDCLVRLSSPSGATISVGVTVTVECTK